MGNNRLADGLLLGAILGSAAFFLLGTKKGNKVLKILTEESQAALDSVMSDLDNRRNGVSPTPRNLSEVSDDLTEKFEESPLAEEVKAKPPKRRLFKKSN